MICWKLIRIFPETLKYWIGVQQGQFYLMGESAFLALNGHPSSDAFTIKIPYEVDVLLHRPASHPVFSHWVVKTKSDFIVRSVEIGLCRWMLVVPVISVNAYPFLVFLDLTCHLEDTRIGVFCLHCVA